MEDKSISEPCSQESAYRMVSDSRPNSRLLSYFCAFFLSRIRSDHNEDNTSKILQEWSQNVKNLYHRVLINVSSTASHYEDASSPGEWSESRYQHMMYLRQRALDGARKQWADYLFVCLKSKLVLVPMGYCRL